MKIDIHSHLLPGVDDGCRNLNESLACARMLVSAGYSHSFCTPHIWPNLPANNVREIPAKVAALQTALDSASIPLKLFPGGELNLGRDITTLFPDQIVTHAMAGKYILIDLWADRLPPHFDPNIRWLQSLGLTVILAHPERLRAVQDNPAIADHFDSLGLLLQGNLKCLTDSLASSTRRTIDLLLQDNRYTFLATDLHNPESLPPRLDGLSRAADLIGSSALDRLTIENPRRLIPAQ